MAIVTQYTPNEYILVHTHTHTAHLSYMSSLRRPDSCKGHAELGTMSVMIATDDILISVKRRNMLINHSKGRNKLI